MAGIDVSKYEHSPVHKAIILKDHAALKSIIANLPKLCDPAEIKTEEVSISEVTKANAISAVINRRDVPNRETPLHLAVKLGDVTATEMLILAGANQSLQNEQGWSAVQEAICSREEAIARIMVKHHRRIRRANWRRGLQRWVGTIRRMKDFYMEITFHFESSAIPFISRIAPSDTYKIWKRGANIRADMTLAGFDNFKILRSDQSILFLGDGSEDGKVGAGSLCVISHKDKKMMNASLVGGGNAPLSDSAARQKVAAMSQKRIHRPGINVNQAVLVPQMTWRRQERTETVGPWKTKVYDMHNVMVSLRSRTVPGVVMTSSQANENKIESKDFNDILTEEEKKQLEIALKSEENGDGVMNAHRHSQSCGDICSTSESGGSGEKNKQEKEKDKEKKGGKLSGWKKKDGKNSENDKKKKKELPSRNSFSVDDDHKDTCDFSGESSTSGQSGNSRGEENVIKKGVRPVLWLSQNYPLQIDEFLPLLDILADKVKAVRRLRELLTTKLPQGTFPVKVAIPIVPTIRVLVTFTKFEEMEPLEEEDEFSTPPSSPTFSDKEPSEVTQASSSSRFKWKMPAYSSRASSSTSTAIPINRTEDIFKIPPNYTKW